MIKMMVFVIVAACCAVSGICAEPCKGATNGLADVVMLELVWCRPGTFWMGSSSNEVGRSGDEMRHRVTLTHGFWLGKYPVTQRQWKAVMGEGNRSTCKLKWKELPMDDVSWDECQAFIRKVNERLEAGSCTIENGNLKIDNRRKKQESGKTKFESGKLKLEDGKAKVENGSLKLGDIRLPTEAEWEYACRAGTEGSCAGDLNNMGWTDDTSKGEAHPVGQKKPNAWGLHDMHGNVWEWCSDFYGDYPACDVVDPKGPELGGTRVLRGGSWYTYTRFCRSAARSFGDPAYRYSGLGFRLARSESQSGYTNTNKNAK